MNLFKRTALAAALFAAACAPAVAQWQTGNHSVPIGRGAGATGFKSAVPGVAGLPLISNGATADPSFAPVASSGVGYTAPGGVATAPATTVNLALQREGIWANDFGACQPGATNDAPAFQNALALSTTLRLPTKFTGACPTTATINITADNELSGVGFAAIQSSNPAINVITITTNLAVQLRDFRVSYASAAAPGTSAIAVTAGAGTENSLSIFERLILQGNLQTGITFIKASHYTVRNSTISANFVGIATGNVNFADSGDSTIENNIIQAGPGGFAIYWTSSGGLRVLNNKILGADMTAGLQIDETSNAQTGIILVTGNSIEGLAVSNGSAISLTNSGTSNSLYAITIASNELTGARCLYIPANAANWLNTVSVAGNVCNIFGTGLAAFDIASGDTLSFVGNTVTNNGTSNSVFKIGTNVSNAYLGPTPVRGSSTVPNTYNSSVTVYDPFGVTFANLSSVAANGSQVYVTNATAGSSPCTGGGSGAMATRQNGAWKCF